jgi:uncharacterized protein (TIRG00374 family)
MRMSAQRIKFWPPNKNWLRWGGTIIASTLFIRSLLKLNWIGAWDIFKSLPANLVLLALALYTIGMLANSIRWHILLRTAAIQIPAWETIKIVFLGAFISNYLPSTIGGDAIRFLSVLRFTTRRTVAFTSVILDRALNVTAMFTIVPFSLLTFYPILWSRKLSPTIGSFILLVALGSSISTAGWFSRYKHSFAGWLVKVWAAIKIWLRSPLSLLLAFAVSWLSIFVVFLAIWILAQGMGIQVALFQVMGVTAITYILTLLPISVNGYGVREVAITTLYMDLGATLEQASTLAILTRALMLLVTLPGAIFIPQNLSGVLKQKPSLKDELVTEVEQ